MTKPNFPNKIQKPHFIIRVSNTITYLQRKAWTLLYLNARNSLEDKFHYIELSLISNTLKAHYDQHLKDSLEAIATTGVQWNITDDDGCVKSWTTASMVASATIEEGSTVLQYEFSEKMKELFRANPQYATLEISVMNKLKSKHALALWEFCKIFIATQSGSTGWKSVEEWRGVFAIQKGKYKEFKLFKFHVLEKAVAEVNKFSDINVTAEYKRVGRSVSKIKFVLKRNTKEVKKLEQKLEEGLSPQVIWFNKQSKKSRRDLKIEFEERVAKYITHESLRHTEWMQFLKIKKRKSEAQMDFMLN